MATGGVWQDREIRFDLSSSGLKLRKGEFVIDAINSVEDTKGNNGERGSLEVTNLRLLWAAHKNVRTNLSIGFNCILGIKIKLAQSLLRGNTQALYIMTKFNDSRFEFVFTSLVKASPRLFTTVQAVYRAYETSKLYRDLKLRGSIIRDMNLMLLPHEQVYTKDAGVWNLSSEQGNLGTFYVTNVRVVWHANLAQNFNVSIPYMQIKAIRIRDSKFGKALLVETSRESGGYILGFRVDPEERLRELHSEITSLFKVFGANPIFGVDFSIEEAQPDLEQLKIQRRQDDVEIVAEESSAADVFASYYAATNKNKDREPVYNEQLGLAVECLPEGLTISQLWNII